eukprot:TRINITY_DN5345_c0_g1_i1.p1 TRINITY_DN5345_c0_g1~~TRINITY_DN5345_c0_g1_i1.p1  ORF type:complete len:541 (-),score=132.04 TRINITY_DN5345_c0_g1_i1:46-1668(-)
MQQNKKDDQRPLLSEEISSSSSAIFSASPTLSFTSATLSSVAQTLSINSSPKSIVVVDSKTDSADWPDSFFSPYASGEKKLDNSDGKLTLALTREILRRRHEYANGRNFFCRHLQATILFSLILIAGIFWIIFREQLSPYQHKILAMGSIPVVSVAFTYFHIYLALQMTFYPLEFWGCFKPYLGWQGIIPSKAVIMAETAVDLMTTQLIKVEDVFGRLDPQRVAEEVAPLLHSMLGNMIEEMAMKQAPTIWVTLPDYVKKEIIQKAVEDAPPYIRAMMAEIKSHVAEIFDLKLMVKSAFVKDKGLLNMLFLTCGADELRLIKVLGAYIGFVFGALQMIVYLFYESWWMLPVSGFVIGYLTNWLALKMIFRPTKPVRLCGMEWQGLFLKRQVEVSVQYAQMIPANILNGKRLMEALLGGPSSDKLFMIIAKHVQAGVDAYVGVPKSLIDMTIGSDEYIKTKADVVDRILLQMPAYAQRLEAYTDQAMDLENLLFDKLSALDPDRYEGLLHPVFEQDEWKLVLLGGILGLLVGILQVVSLQK